MLPPDGESDRFLIAKDLKLVGHRRGKFVFCYFAHTVSVEAKVRHFEGWWFAILCVFGDNSPFSSGINRSHDPLDGPRGT